MGSSCLIPARGALGGGSGPAHPIPAPRAAPCFPLQSQGRRARLARSLLCLPQRQDLSQSFPCPRSRCRLGHTPLGITPNTPRGQHPHHGSASPALPPALHNPPQVFILSKSLAKQPPPCSLGKARCLQVAQRKGSGEEPFNLFSHSNIQTGSRSLSQEVSAFGKRSAIQGHVLERVHPQSGGREGKHPRAQQGTEPRWCKKARGGRWSRASQELHYFMF